MAVCSCGNSNKCNVGYGFVNMTSPEATWRLYKAFHHQNWEVFNSRKICEVTYARVQVRINFALINALFIIIFLRINFFFFGKVLNLELYHFWIFIFIFRDWKRWRSTSRTRSSRAKWITTCQLCFRRRGTASVWRIHYPYLAPKTSPAATPLPPPLITP